MKRIFWLDLCRSLAIILVIYGHIEILICCDVWLYKVFPLGGFVGVQLFFVLSGFLIGGIILDYDNNRKWLLNFYLRRWYRTIPNYYLFFIINIFLLELGIRASGNFSTVSYIIFTQNFAWSMPNFYPESWSLAAEEIFYLILPAIIYFVNKKVKDKEKITLIVSLTIIFLVQILRFLYVAISNPNFDEGVRKITLLQMDSFAIGMVLQCISRKIAIINLKKYGVLCFPLIFTQLIYSIIVENNFNNSYFAKTILFLMTNIGCAGLIISGLHISANRSIVKLAEFISKLSFSIYLVNLPLIYIFIHMNIKNYLSNSTIIYLFILFTILISYLNYNYFEKFFLNKRKKYISNV